MNDLEISLIVPTREQVENAKSRGVNLLFELYELFRTNMERILNGEEVNSVSMMFSKKSDEDLKQLGINLSESSAHTYITEVNRYLDREFIKNNKEIKISFTDAEDCENLIKDAIDNIDIDNWTGDVVTNAAIGSIIQNFDTSKFKILNENEEPGKIYKIGVYKDATIWINPYMTWDDMRLLFILK